jgi:hypothetical protein
LLIDGTQAYVIENCTYIQNGNIFVSDWATLTVRNAELLIEQTYPDEHTLMIRGHANFRIKDGNMSKCSAYASEATEVVINSSQMNACMYSGGSSKFTIVESELWMFKISQQSELAIVNSTIGCIQLWLDDYSAGRIDSLAPANLGYWNSRQSEPSGFLFNLTLVNSLVEQWGLRLSYGSKIVVSNSNIEWVEITFRRAVANLENFMPGSYANSSLGSIAFENTSVKSCGIDIFGGAIVSINSSILNHLLTLHENGTCSILDSHVSGLSAIDYFGEVDACQTTFRSFDIRNSNFYVRGNVELQQADISTWVSSNITRNFSVTTISAHNDLIGNVTLSMVDKDNKLVWNGATDSLGQTDFNLTLADNNYTDTLRLEATKGNYSAEQDVGFLSDTPVILKMRYFADLNGDGKINIVDIAVVAKAFDSKPGDPSWNETADLDKNGTVNIIDITMVAKDYGKTV